MSKKPPFGFTATAARLNAGKSCAVPLEFATALPSRSNSCHATLPPLPKPVPSVHANSVLPCLSTASTGCLRLFGVPGAAIGFTSPEERFAKYTCPPVSHDPSTPCGPSANVMLVIGHALISHLCSSLPVNVAP